MLVLAKSLTLKFFMWWARLCQASYPVPVTGLVSVTLLLISNSLQRIGFRSSSRGWLQSRTALSPQLPWVYSYGQCSFHLLRISCSSVTHFLDLSWIVEDLPCFSEVRSSSSWYALLLLFLFRQVSIFVHRVPIQSSFAFFTTFWILLFASYFFCSFCFIPFHLLSSKRLRTSLVTYSIFLLHSFPSISLAASVTAVL